MPPKRFFIAAMMFFYAVNCFAQETVEKKNKIYYGLTERYTVLKDSQDVKEGLYQVFTKKDKLVARGAYTHGKKTGIWHFYNRQGKLLQIYQYNGDSLKFEAKQYEGSNIAYKIDRKIKDSDVVTKPVKIGGRLLGYLPYLALYRTPFNPYEYNMYGAEAVIELLISPLGRLADYKITVTFPYMDYTQTLKMSLAMFKEEDKEFIPATFNHQPVLCRIIILCRLDEDGQLQLRYADEY